MELKKRSNHANIRDSIEKFRVRKFISENVISEENRKQEEDNMKKIGIFMADGCEEIEGLTVVDVVRRAGIAIDMISITGKKEVAGAHGITFAADVLAEEADFDSYDGIVLPGGMPGTLNLGKHEIVKKVITSYAAGGKLTAAICAAPSVLGENGILEGKHAVSYPGFEEKLLGARVGAEKVAVDGNIVTSRGMGTAIEFAMAIVKWLVHRQILMQWKQISCILNKNNQKLTNIIYSLEAILKTG